MKAARLAESQQTSLASVAQSNKKFLISPLIRITHIGLKAMGLDL